MPSRPRPVSKRKSAAAVRMTIGASAMRTFRNTKSFLDYFFLFSIEVSPVVYIDTASST
jgi:hypothetical protein